MNQMRNILSALIGAAVFLSCATTHRLGPASDVFVLERCGSPVQVVILPGAIGLTDHVVDAMNWWRDQVGVTAFTLEDSENRVFVGLKELHRGLGGFTHYNYHAETSCMRYALTEVNAMFLGDNKAIRHILRHELGVVVLGPQHNAVAGSLMSREYRPRSETEAELLPSEIIVARFRLSENN